MHRIEDSSSLNGCINNKNCGQINLKTCSSTCVSSYCSLSWKNSLKVSCCTKNYLKNCWNTKNCIKNSPTN